jgi:hypothetical protein
MDVTLQMTPPGQRMEAGNHIQFNLDWTGTPVYLGKTVFGGVWKSCKTIG